MHPITTEYKYKIDRQKYLHGEQWKVYRGPIKQKILFDVTMEYFLKLRKMASWPWPRKHVIPEPMRCDLEEFMRIAGLGHGPNRRLIPRDNSEVYQLFKPRAPEFIAAVLAARRKYRDDLRYKQETERLRLHADAERSTPVDGSDANLENPEPNPYQNIPQLALHDPPIDNFIKLLNQFKPQTFAGQQMETFFLRMKQYLMHMQPGPEAIKRMSREQLLVARDQLRQAWASRHWALGRRHEDTGEHNEATQILNALDKVINIEADLEQIYPLVPDGQLVEMQHLYRVDGPMPPSSPKAPRPIPVDYGPKSEKRSSSPAAPLSNTGESADLSASAADSHAQVKDDRPEVTTCQQSKENTQPKSNPALTAPSALVNPNWSFGSMDDPRALNPPQSQTPVVNCGNPASITISATPDNRDPYNKNNSPTVK